METKQILKTLREGCLSGPDGVDLSAAVGENGDQEITGQDNLSMGIKISDKIVGKQIWNITNLSLKVEADEEAKEAGFPHSSLDNYKFDPETMDW